MKIKTIKKKRTIEVEIEETTFIYSQEAIKKMIQIDLARWGYRAKDVNFVTEGKELEVVVTTYSD